MVAERAWPQVTVATISFHDRADLDKLAERLDILAVDHAAGTVDALLRPEQLRCPASRRPHASRVDVAQRAPSSTPPAPSPPARSAASPAMPAIARWRRPTPASANWPRPTPTLATWTDVGDSWDKATPAGDPGYDINALVLTNQAVPGPKPKLMIISAIHAREYATAELATRFAELLVNNYGIDPDITWLLDYTELHLIPQANPDGRKAGRERSTPGARMWTTTTAAPPSLAISAQT